MLNKKFKLKTKDFARFKKGEIINTPFFRIVKHKNNEPKIGIVISKKYVKKANKRNELKRKICYAYYELFKNLVKKENVFIITLIKKQNENKREENLFNYNEIKHQIKQLLNNN